MQGNHIIYKKAKLYLSFGNIYDEIYFSNEEIYKYYKIFLKEKLNSRILGNPEDFIFKYNELYDNEIHLNTKGKVRRTKILIELLKKELKKE